MRRFGIGALAGLAALLVVAPGSAQADTCAGADDPLNANVAQSERTLLCLTNVHRASSGLGAMAMDSILQQTARLYSEELYGLNAFNHYGGRRTADNQECTEDDAKAHEPGCDLPWDRAQANGFPSNQVSENLARGYLPTPQDVFQGFRNSPDHNTEMLKPEWLVAGMGISGGPYITELFSSWDSGATDTAVDLLITDECVAARNLVGSLEQNVAAKQAALDAAKDRLEKAKKKGRKKKRKAKKAVKQAEKDLEQAQSALAAAQAGAQAACTATHY